MLLFEFGVSNPGSRFLGIKKVRTGTPGIPGEQKKHQCRFWRAVLGLSGDDVQGFYYVGYFTG